MEKNKIQKSQNQLLLENEELLQRIYELEDTLTSIRNGEIDAIVVSGVDGERIYSLTSVETKYRIIIEEMNEGAITLTKDGLITFCNAGFAELISEPVERIVGSYFTDFLQKSEEQKFLRLFHEGLISKSVGEITYIKEDGNSLNLLLSSRALPVDAQDEVCILFSDITELRRQEKELINLNNALEQKVAEKTKELTLSICDLKSTSRRLELALRSSKAGTWDWDIINGNIEWSQQMFNLFGLDSLRTNASFDVWRDILHPEDIEIAEKRIELALKDHTFLNSDYRVILPSGQIRWINATGEGIYDELGKPSQMIGLCVDITERKLAEAALIKSERLLRESQSVARLGSFEWDLSTGLWESSEILDQIFGIGANYNRTLDGWASIVHPDWQKKMTDFVINEVLGQLRNFDKEYQIIRQNDQEVRWVHGIAAIEFNADNYPVRLFGTISDITGRKNAEKELIRAREKAEESDRLKSAFLANMSHEIRTPMNGILGFAELLKEPELTGEQQQEYISIIEKSGARMLNIINDIMDISKIESGLMTLSIMESNINCQIEYLYSFFKTECESKKIQLSMKNDLPSNQAIIKTDGDKVFAILTNLIKNAIKFSNSGAIEFGYMEKLNELEFFVKDEGIGIPKNMQEAIFERFIQVDIEQRNAYQGAGLGLAISKSYVEMLGGKIWVESENGIGSTFYFTLPYNNEVQEYDTAEENKSENDRDQVRNKLKILVAEDDEASQQLISIFIKPFSKELLLAENGVEAVEICRNNPDLDLVLMDINMPQMDGHVATNQIRKFNEKIIIIAQTSFAQLGDRNKALEAGCNDYIPKPIEVNLLSNLIRKYFN